MPKLKQLVAELEDLQRKLSEVELSMSKATSVIDLQLLELDETKLVEAYQRKNAELLRKKQRLRKKEFALGQQSGTLRLMLQFQSDKGSDTHVELNDLKIHTQTHIRFLVS